MPPTLRRIRQRRNTGAVGFVLKLRIRPIPPPPDGTVATQTLSSMMQSSNKGEQTWSLVNRPPTPAPLEVARLL